MAVCSYLYIRWSALCQIKAYEQLTDTVTSLALSSMGLAPPTGASVNISCEFVRPAGKEGEQLYSIGEVVKLGQSRHFQVSSKNIVAGC